MPDTSAAAVSPALLTSLRHGLSNASDAQLRQVLSMVDSMGERGAIDVLLAPLRPRLAQLHPARPLRFARLLFLPLDPIIVASQLWVAGAPSIPRGAIVPITEQVRAALGDEAAVIEEMIAGRNTADADVVCAAAGLLWPRAGEILAGASCPAGWVEAGLSVTAHAAIAHMVAIVLRLAVRMDALARGTLPASEIRALVLEQILDQAQAAGPAAWRVIGLLLLLRLEQKQEVLRALTATNRQRDTAIRVASDQVVEAALDQLETLDHGKGETLAEAASRLDGLITLLESIVTGGVGPARSQRVQTLRIQLDATCQARLRHGLSEQVLAPLGAIAGSAADEATVVRHLSDMENAARSLRLLESAGQRLGKNGPYTKLLREAAEQIQVKAPCATVTAADQARLVELLVGPEAGLATLKAARSQQAA